MKGRVIFKETASVPVRKSRYVKTLEDLIQCLIDNDPEAPIADNGMRVIDQWRSDAQRVLALSSTPQNTAAD